MSRYQPRDRTPPRFPDRRPSINHNAPSGQFGFRNSIDANQVPLGREPPRGPKADTIRHGSQPAITPRGRGGFGSRLEFRDRDRDVRDFRDAPAPFRRDNDRGDWPRRDRDVSISDRDRDLSGNRDGRVYVGQDRSASPTRARRDSRDGPLSQSGRSTEGANSWYPPSIRGGPIRGRGGRPDWDRGRGRGSFVGERDREPFRPRSRSREAWRDRDRDWDRDLERRDRFDRRDRSPDREDKAREPALWRRDQSTGRNSVGNTGPATPQAPNAAMDSVHARAASLERPPERPFLDSSRRFSTALTPSGFSRDGRKEDDRSDYFQSRGDTLVKEPVAARASSPPSAPEVPAFGGSLNNLKPSVPAPAAAPTLSVEKSKPSIQPVTSTETSESAPQVPFQPPTGPKAERGLNVLGGTPRDPRSHVSEPWPKVDPQARTMRPISNPIESKPTLDVRSSVIQPAADGRDTSGGIHREVNAFQGIPTGPRAGTSQSIKPRPSIMQNVPPTTPTLVSNRQPAPVTSPVSQRPGGLPSARVLQPRGMGANQWLSPDYKPPRPSIMNPMPTKSFQAESRDRPYSSQVPRTGGFNHLQNLGQKPRIFQHLNDDRSRMSLKASHHESGRSDALAASIRDSQEERYENDRDLSGLPLSMEQSSDDEGEEDDGLDEDDFALSEEKHLREMKLLSAKKPPPPLEDPIIVGLLLRIQMLGMIKDGAIPAELQKPLSEPEPEVNQEVLPTGLPSPKTDEEKADAIQQVGRFLKELPTNPIPTPPIEDLPYLAQEPMQLHTFEQWEEEDEQEDVSVSLQRELEQNAWAIHNQLEHLRDEFDDNYKEWKTMMMDFERQRRGEIGLTPVPASPPLSVGQTPLLTPLIERTRGSKNTTELDLQNILRASEQSAREEQEKRDREATARPNYDLEAVIPPMLDPQDVEMFYFEDTNRLIPTSNALDVFAFVPPQDDFTPEEQKIFISAFCQNPKKWGKIAESLPDRDYRQCILHYYLTKDIARYKEYWRKTLPKKGRKRGAAGSQRRSNALIYDGEEAELVPVAVTDTGRPRRAAAPTFGDTVADLEAPVLGTSIARRLLVASKDGALEPGSEKPAGRGRKAGAAQKPRKPRAQVQQTPQTLQVPSDISAGTSPVKVERAMGPASKASKGVSRGFFGSKIEDLPILEPQYALEQDLNRGQPLGTLADMPMNHNGLSPMLTGNQPSSYWSVPEQQKFPALIAHFGRDFDAIANFMKTKTVTMVCN